LRSQDEELEKQIAEDHQQLESLQQAYDRSLAYLTHKELEAKIKEFEQLKATLAEREQSVKELTARNLELAISGRKWLKKADAERIRRWITTSTSPKHEAYSFQHCPITPITTLFEPWQGATPSIYCLLILGYRAKNVGLWCKKLASGVRQRRGCLLSQHNRQ
jgi:hypothetical protein